MVTIKDAKNATDAIVKTLKPVSVAVFGSVARQKRGNDLDLLVITDGSLDRKEENHLLYKCLKKFHEKFGVDSLVVPIHIFTKYYNEGSPFLELIIREGRVLYMKKAIEEWTKQSKDELDTAKYLLNGGYFKGACYHAQQSAEKAIKSILLENGWKLEKTHDIDYLIKIGKKFKIKLTLPDEEIEFMNSIYTGRYPSEAGLLPFGEPSKKDAAKAVSIANNVYKNISDLISNQK